MTNRREEATQKRKQKNNGVVLEQHYPSLLARGTTFHPLTLPSVSGAVRELVLTQTTLRFKQTDSAAFRATAVRRVMSFTAERKERQSGIETSGHNSYLFLSWRHFQLFHLRLCTHYWPVQLWGFGAETGLCRSRRPLFRNRMQQMRPPLSPCHKLQQRDYPGCWHCRTRSSKTDFSRETILVLHHPAPADLNVMNFTTPLQAVITEEEGGGASEEIKKLGR